MSIITLEGVTEGGQIKLQGNVHLPDNIKVYVVPNLHVEGVAHLQSPHLAHPEEAPDFKMQVVQEGPRDAL
jgi:hypothetical protein